MSYKQLRKEKNVLSYYNREIWTLWRCIRRIRLYLCEYRTFYSRESAILETVFAWRRDSPNQRTIRPMPLIASLIVGFPIDEDNAKATMIPEEVTTRGIPSFLDRSVRVCVYPIHGMSVRWCSVRAMCCWPIRSFRAESHAAHRVPPCLSHLLPSPLSRLTGGSHYTAAFPLGPAKSLDRAPSLAHPLIFPPPPPPLPPFCVPRSLSIPIQRVFPAAPEAAGWLPRSVDRADCLYGWLAGWCSHPAGHLPLLPRMFRRSVGVYLALPACL